MSGESPSNREEFDAYASTYDAALRQGISVSGEDKEYFVQGRLAWLARCLGDIREIPATVMDYGCGTGSAVPFIFESLGVERLLGVDSSLQSLNLARQKYGNERVQFIPIDQYQPAQVIDLVYSNGVFHHIPVTERASAINYIHRSLGPGGLFALWENNPWNIGTRYVMSRIPFDRDAIMLWPAEIRRLLTNNGFEILSTDFLFIFPRLLRSLRGLERRVSRMPLGAQYQVLCRKV